LTGGQSSHLLIIGAYRNNDTSELHPLQLTIEELRKAGARIEELALKPLSIEPVVALLGDTLRLGPPAVLPLGEVLLRKTDGNPFFLQQFLTTLAEQKLLRFDSELGRWTWDNARIEVAVASDNVVDLLIARLRRLSEAARHVLTLGACIGQEFDLAALSLIWERPRADLTPALWEALREGLLIPLDGSYRYLAEGPRADEQLAEALSSRYRFLHDRVQQAAYELVDGSDRAKIHAHLGRLLLDKAGGEPNDEGLFEIVRQMNLGQAFVVGDEDRRRLAR
jgi:predicted ATPase